MKTLRTIAAIASLVFGAGAAHSADASRIPFQFIDNRVFIPVSLSGHGPYAFILDTGSSDWDVSGGIARQLGLKLERSENIQGAGESKVSSNIFRVPQATVGSARFDNQTFYSTDFSVLNRVIGFAHFDGVAGAQVFSRYAVTIDFDKSVVTLSDPAKFTPPSDAIRIPFTTPDGSTPLVDGRIAGIAGKFIVDTGDRSSLTLFGPFWRAHHLDQIYAPVRTALTGYGAGGPIHGLIARIPRFDFGGAQAQNIVARLSLQKSGGFADASIAGSIGAGLLRRFRVTFDYAHKQIVLERDANFTGTDRFDRSGLWLGHGASGFEVYDVIPDSPASAAGLRVGDVVTAVDGVPVSRMDLFALRARLADPKAQNEVVMHYRRGNRTAAAHLALRDLDSGSGMSEQAFDYWDFFRRECERAGDVPLYLDIVTGIGQDDDLKELASHVKAGQPMANIILASVHYLLLHGAQHPLRAFYPNLNGGARRDGHAFPLFKDFVNVHRTEVDALIRRGVTNTNEVARCSTLNAGFRAVAKEASSTLALIEIGPSAGLNMFWDSYRVRYSKGDETHVVGPDNAPLTIDCELQGDRLPPFGSPPTIASRVGLELNPVDLSDPHWRDWLKALVWPDQLARFARLEKAIEFARTQTRDIRPGSALDNLANAIAEVPQDIPVCVYHTYVIYQFSDAMRDALDAVLTTASLRRPIWRLSAEGSLASPGDVPLTLRYYHDGVKSQRQIALAHPHGKWLKWMDA